jgi:hypothetical protein
MRKLFSVTKFTFSLTAALVLQGFSTTTQAQALSYLSTTSCSQDFSSSDLCSMSIRVNTPINVLPGSQYILTVVQRSEGQEKLVACLDENGGTSHIPWIAKNQLYDFRSYRVHSQMFNCANQWRFASKSLEDLRTVGFGSSSINGGVQGPLLMNLAVNLDDAYEIRIDQRGNVLESIWRGGQEGLQVIRAQGFIPASSRRIVGTTDSYRSSVQILEQPHSGNGFTTRLLVLEKAPGRRTINVELRFE